MAALDCRLAALLTTARDAGLSRLAESLRRAGHDLHRADLARGQRRVRALRRAARGASEFASRVRSGRRGAAVPADVRAALVDDARGVSADLTNLVESGGNS